jgi:tetratricopeptide (TPR) repeat protein
LDSLINAAARALARGDPLGALDRVALRDDAPALALRGIAMAQLGDLARARALLRRAGRAFGPKESLARARCVVAEAEVALAARDLAPAESGTEQALEIARDILAAQGDSVNAAHARYLAIRRLLLLGRLDAAEAQLRAVSPKHLPPKDLPPAHRATHDLLAGGIALRRLATKPAAAALARAARAAAQSRIPALIAEVELAARMLDAPAARRLRPAPKKLLTLAEIEKLLKSGALVIDGCRHRVVRGKTEISLSRRPVLFALLQALGLAAPHDAGRDALIAAAFGGRQADDSHRARLRVEMARLRAALRGFATIEATRAGFALTPRGGRVIVLLAHPVAEKHAGILALLADGESWSSSALALALGTSQRHVQRGLDDLVRAGKVQAIGQARARRWIMTPMPGVLGAGALGTRITTTLLLPAPLPGD